MALHVTRANLIYEFTTHGTLTGKPIKGLLLTLAER